jgi:hypothetical protein
MNPQLLGTFAACLVEGVNPAEFETVKGASQQMRAGANAEAFGRQIAALAEEIFVKSGHANDLEARIYGELAKTASWNDFHYDMLVPVYSALNRFQARCESAKQATSADATIEKSAGVVGAALQTFFPLLASSPGLLFGTAGVAGAGLGALNWSLNRAANGVDAESATIENQIDNYNDLRREISEELRRNPPPELRAAMRKKLESAQEPGYAL